MRFSIFALATTLAVASAQSLGDIPTCALTCFSIAVPASGCSLTDQECQCTTGKKSIEKSIAECVPSKCSNEDILKINPAVTKLCAAAGITISDLPTAVSATGAAASKTGSTSATTTAAAASSVSSAASEFSGAAVANGVTFGAAALGLAAVFGI